MWLKTAEENMNQEFSNCTNLLQVTIKEEPTDDSSIYQTNEHQSSETIEHIKQEYSNTDLELKTSSRNDTNLIDIDDHVILKQETEGNFSNEDISQSRPQIKKAQKRDLKINIQLHKGKKPYKCDVCDKVFSHLCNLKRHTLVHTNEKPFNCDVCDSSFGRLSSLKEHKILHI